ncbi:MAG: hypothetical protein NT074_00395 [Methanomicrobiales archaeon]|nr:hypothetical protein [Methanomicrobiales archaeon]
MAKYFVFKTRSLGSNPDLPDRGTLASWIVRHPGMEADLTTVLTDISLEPQYGAGIDTPCAGGQYYRERVLASLTGVSGRDLVDEPSMTASLLVRDLESLEHSLTGTWFCLPAPHALGLVDAYYDDPDEFSASLTTEYRRVLRTMRDEGIAGHVMFCDRVLEEEASALKGKKVILYCPGATQDDLEVLLECQDSVVVDASMVPGVIDALDEYPGRKVVVTHPDEATCRLLYEHFEQGRFEVGGYCTGRCEPFWSDLMGAARVIRVPLKSRQTG